MPGDAGAVRCTGVTSWPGYDLFGKGFAANYGSSIRYANAPTYGSTEIPIQLDGRTISNSFGLASNGDSLAVLDVFPPGLSAPPRILLVHVDETPERVTATARILATIDQGSPMSIASGDLGLYVLINKSDAPYTSSLWLFTESGRSLVVDNLDTWSEVSAGSKGEVYVTVPSQGKVLRVGSNGQVRTAVSNLDNPHGSVAVSPTGAMFVATGPQPQRCGGDFRNSSHRGTGVLVTKVLPSGAKSPYLIGNLAEPVGGVFWAGGELKVGPDGSVILRGGVLGLVNHRFAVEAFDPSGTGAPRAMAHDGKVDVFWDPPENLGGQPASYIVTAISLDGKAQIEQRISPLGALGRKATFEGLTCFYRFTIRAENPLGSGPVSKPSEAVSASRFTPGSGSGCLNFQRIAPAR
jgi:hypothetical protein